MRQCFDNAVGNLRAAGNEAVAALRQALTDPSGSVRVRAAVAILEMGMNAGKLSDLAARLERLEQIGLDEPVRFLEPDHHHAHADIHDRPLTRPSPFRGRIAEPFTLLATQMAENAGLRPLFQGREGQRGPAVRIPSLQQRVSANRRSRSPNRT